MVEEQSTLKASKSLFYSTYTEDIKSKYENFQKINQGGYGEIYTATEIETSTIRAIKKIESKRIKDTERLSSEIKIMQKTDSPYTVRLHEIYQDNKYLYIVMEYCSGGDLLSYMRQVKTLNERTASILFKQIIAAVFYMHEHNIVHRDLKPENLLFLDDFSNLILKLCDFGVSKLIQTPSSRMRTRVGTKNFIAPEVTVKNNEYTSSCDLWSAGVILYFFLSGKLPFEDKRESNLFAKIRAGEFDLETGVWATVSFNAKNLILNLLKVNPAERLTAKQVLDHPWISEFDHNPEKLLELNELSIKSFCDSKKLRKLFLLCVSTKCTDLEIKTLRESFITLDENHDGTLSAAEIEKVISAIPSLNTDVAMLMDSMDYDKSGMIDYSEFIACTMDNSILLQKERLYQAFKTFDSNGDGFITADELVSLLGKEGDVVELAVCEEMIKQCDENSDGCINFEEFIDLVEDHKFVDVFEGMEELR